MKIAHDKMPQIERDVARLGDIEARIGVFGTAGGVPGDPTFTYAELAYVNEFGSQAAGVPQRSFIRSAFDGQRAAIEKLAAQAARAVVSGKVKAQAAVALLGEWGVAQVRAGMVRGIAPPLAPATLAKRKRIQSGKRGRDVPLIDTGRLRQAVTYDVREGGSE